MDAGQLADNLRRQQAVGERSVGVRQLGEGELVGAVLQRVEEIEHADHLVAESDVAELDWRHVVFRQRQVLRPDVVAKDAHRRLQGQLNLPKDGNALSFDDVSKEGATFAEHFVFSESGKKWVSFQVFEQKTKN